MNLRLFDTATGDVRPLGQRDVGKVSMYVCGPTVYDFPHVGHGRSVLVYDILRRYLESRGQQVHHVANVTDIDDKIINRATKEDVAADAITTKWEAEYWSAIDRLGVQRPNNTPHATEYVAQMIELIDRLLDNGYAYETENSIYLDATRVKGYGLLARQDLDSLRAGARIEVGEEKRSPVDFVLWKKESAVGPPNAPTWESPWGPGRPGWHTECVAMSLDILGEGFDIHGGGIDLCFPHHENERAQAVALGADFAQHWVHHGFIEVDGEKMGKSLNNFTTLTDLLDRTDPRAYRLLVLRAHYRSPLEVQPDIVADAETALARLDDFARRFADVTDVEPDRDIVDTFNSLMDNDLDTPRAIAELFGVVRAANAGADAGEDVSAKVSAVRAMCAAVGLELKVGDHKLDDAAHELARQRDEARAQKQWADADRLRDELQALGWTVEDGPTGTKIHR